MEEKSGPFILKYLEIAKMRDVKAYIVAYWCEHDLEKFKDATIGEVDHDALMAKLEEHLDWMQRKVNNGTNKLSQFHSLMEDAVSNEATWSLQYLGNEYAKLENE